MRDAGELRNTIGMLRVGDKVEIGLLRDGKPLQGHGVDRRTLRDRELRMRSDIHQGLEGADLADAPDGGGVLVRAVQEGSPAAQAGLRANDLIVAVGRTPVSNTKAFREAAKGANLLVLNVRRGSAVVLIPHALITMKLLIHLHSRRHRIPGHPPGRPLDQGRPPRHGAVARPRAAQAPAGAARAHARELRRLRGGAAQRALSRQRRRDQSRRHPE